MKKDNEIVEDVAIDETIDNAQTEEKVEDVETETTESFDETNVETTEETTPNKKQKALAIIKKIFNRYFIDAFTGMAQGLFCTLIAGTILAQIASWCGDNSFAKALDAMAKIAKMLMGAGIGVGIATKLGAKPLVIFTAAVTGLIGAFSGNLVETMVNGADFALAFGAPGNPIGAYVIAVLTVEVASLYAGKTKLDIVLIPLGMMLLSVVGIFVAWPFIKLIDLIAVVLVLAIEAGTAVKYTLRLLNHTHKLR